MSLYLNKEISDPGFCLYWKNNKPYSPIPPHKKLTPKGDVYKKINATCDMSPKERKKATKSICKSFKNDDSVNPLTGKKIKKGSEVYNSLESFCEPISPKSSPKPKSPKPKKSPKRRVSIKAKKEIEEELEEIEREFVEAEMAKETKNMNPDQKYNPPCLDGLFDDIELNPAQTRVSRELLKLVDDKKFHGILVSHGTGTGKTEIMIGAMSCVIQNSLAKKIILVTTKSLIPEFKKRMDKYGLRFPKRIDFEAMTYDGFHAKFKAGKMECGSDTFLVVDEVHNLRNPRSIKYKDIQECATKSRLVLVLTATPFVNTYQDLVPLLRLIMRPKLSDTLTDVDMIRMFREPEKYEQELKLFKNRLSWFYEKENKNFPELILKETKIRMDPEYEKAYEQLEQQNFSELFPEGAEEKDLSAFYSALRSTTTKIGEKKSAKYEKITRLLSNGKQTVLYSEFLGNGIKVYKDYMDQNDISYAIISGESTATERKRAVNDFNKGNIQVLVISKAGELGLDLMNTRQIIFANLPWNYASYQQVVGRGVRFKSHITLPEEERNVTVYVPVHAKSKSVKIPKAILTPDEEEDEEGRKKKKKKEKLISIDKFPSIDSYLWALIQDKKEKKEKLDETLKVLSIR